MRIGAKQFVVFVGDNTRLARQGVAERPKFAGRRSASKFPSSARLVFCLRFRNQLIKFTGLRVCLDLSIPGLPILLQKPVAKLGKFLSRKPLNLIFDFLYLAHISPRLLKYTPPMTSSLFVDNGARVEPHRRKGREAQLLFPDERAAAAGLARGVGSNGGWAGAQRRPTRVSVQRVPAERFSSPRVDRALCERRYAQSVSKHQQRETLMRQPGCRNEH